MKVIADVETAIAVSTPGTRRVLENTVDNAKKRIVVLDKKIDEAKVERANEQQAQTAAAVMAAKETKLNAKEQETYRGFLEESYFTKRDFGRLDEFYKHSYDRLSEEGKDQMSKRIDEGIRRGEFKFNDLSETVQEKEAKHRAANSAKTSSEKTEVSGSKDASKRPSPLAEGSAVKSNKLSSINLSGMQISDVATTPSAAAIPDASGTKSVQRSV